MMITKDEKSMVRMAWYLVLGGAFQFIFAFSVVWGAGFLDNMSIYPTIHILILFVPAFLWRRLSLMKAIRGKNKDDIDYLMKQWLDTTPKFFLYFPIFQLHSGLFFLYKMAIVLAVRHHRGEKDPFKWFRRDYIFLINHSCD